MTGSRESLDRSGPFWPFGVRAAVLSVPLVLVALLAVLAVLRAASDWPADRWDGWLLLGAAAFALLPVLLVVVGRIAERGGSVRVPGGFELAFAAATAAAGPRTGTTISSNLGAPPGVDIADSGGGNILAALRGAVSNPVAVVDLENGRAWWETRLLLLLSGADRLGAPRAIVFVATRGGAPRQFVGWGLPRELLRCQLAAAPDDIKQAVHRAGAHYLAWALTTPEDNSYSALAPWLAPLPAPLPGVQPVATTPNVQRTELEAQRIYRPRGDSDLLPESALVEELQAVEESPRNVTVVRLQELFEPVLVTSSIDDTDDDETKLRHITGTSGDYIAVTDAGRYMSLVSRTVAVNAVLRSMVGVAGADARRDGTRSRPKAGHVTPRPRQPDTAETTVTPTPTN
jgi:hypothetical protein